MEAAAPKSFVFYSLKNLDIAGKASVPIFCSPRMYIDLSDPD
jgi:hypothetical protein